MPTQQSVRALLSNSQRQTLFSGGRTSLSEDNPVIALGAGYYPIIQEGVNHARLDQQGPYGPLNFSRVAEQSGGQMSVSSGYFDMGGEPHRRQINLRGGITHTWYLNLTNQGLLQQQSILDIRRLFRMAQRPAPDNLTMIQAMHEVVGTMDETPFGEMSLAGVPVETFDLWSILETPGLRYSNVWRQLRDVVNIIDEDHLVGGGTNDNPADRSVKRAMARHLIPDAAAGLAGGGGPSFNPTGQIPVDNERTTLAALQMEFDRHAATYTNSLLSFINERMREGINRMDPNFSVTQQQGPDVAIDTSAVMPEEQAGAVTGGGGTPESQGLPQAIGSTGSMDYAINFMGQIHVGDVSNRTIVEGYQHGLSRGEIMTQERVNELIENNDAATMHSEIYNYYRDQAMPDWNSAIVELKRSAANSYNTAQRNLTPEQMRNPFGASTSPSHGVTARGSHGRNPGQNVRGQLLNDLSTSTNAMLNNLPGLAANHANIEGARTATALVNHMLGTWHQHNGQTFRV